LFFICFCRTRQDSNRAKYGGGACDDEHERVEVKGVRYL